MKILDVESTGKPESRRQRGIVSPFVTLRSLWLVFLGQGCALGDRAEARMVAQGVDPDGLEESGGRSAGETGRSGGQHRELTGPGGWHWKSERSIKNTHRLLARPRWISVPFIRIRSRFGGDESSRVSDLRGLERHPNEHTKEVAGWT